MTINFNDVTDTATPTSGTFNTGGNANVRGSGTNLALMSQTYTNATWAGSTATRADNVTIAPNGTTTAGTFTSVNTAFGGLLRQSGILLATTYTLSAFVKKNNWRYVGLRLGSILGSSERYPFFDFDTLATSTVGISGATFTATDVGNGWYRIVLTGTNSETAGSQIDVAVVASDGSSQTNTGAGNIVNVWGFQYEFGSTANTYIPTTTAAIYGTPTLSLRGAAVLGLESSGSLYVSPVGTGAIQAQATTSTAVGGNARGSNAVDWQTLRSVASMVASSTGSVLVGGQNNSSTSYTSFVGAGANNTASGANASVVSGNANNASGQFAFIGAGASNVGAGLYNVIGGGFTNSGTANAAVTTQSATMNGTTAVTLSGSNANIKVGQYISGTSIGIDTYVAAISGTSLTLSKIATGSTTNTLSFFTPHGIVVGGGNNQATGSYSFIGGGGDAGTAANRNVASGDWSFVGGGRGNTASGVASSILGGGTDGTGALSNLASGIGSVVIGAATTASGDYSIGFGRNALSSGSRSFSFGTASTTRGITANTVFSASNFPISGTAGVQQTALLVLGRETTDATATALTCNSSAAGTTNQVILPNNSAYYFKGSVIANVTGAANGAAWSIEGAIMRGANAASTVLIDTPSVNRVACSAGATAWVVAVTADTTNGGIRVTVTGVASTTIRWVCKLETTEVTY